MLPAIAALGAYLLLTASYYVPGTRASLGVAEVDSQMLAVALSALAGWVASNFPKLKAWFLGQLPDMNRPERMEALLIEHSADLKAIRKEVGA